MRPRSKNHARCPNHSCDFYHQEEGKNIIRKGKNRSGRQEYLCHWCGTRFSETTNTPLHRVRMEDDEIHNICKMALEMNGARAIERMTGHRRETIGRLLSNLGEDPGFSARFLLESKKFSTIEAHELIRILSSRIKKGQNTSEGQFEGEELVR